MEKLIKAYLKHIGHYLANSEVLTIQVVFDGDESLYDIELSNDWLASGCEKVTIPVSSILVFLFERQA